MFVYEVSGVRGVAHAQRVRARAQQVSTEY